MTEQHVQSVEARNKREALASIEREKNDDAVQELLKKYKAFFGTEGQRTELQEYIWKDMRIRSGAECPSFQPGSAYPIEYNDGMKAMFFNIRNICETPLKVMEDLTNEPTKPQTAIT